MKSVMDRIEHNRDRGRELIELAKDAYPEEAAYMAEKIQEMDNAVQALPRIGRRILQGKTKAFTSAIARAAAEVEASLIRNEADLKILEECMEAEGLL